MSISNIMSDEDIRKICGELYDKWTEQPENEGKFLMFVRRRLYNSKMYIDFFYSCIVDSVREEGVDSVAIERDILSLSGIIYHLSFETTKQMTDVAFELLKLEPKYRGRFYHTYSQKMISVEKDTYIFLVLNNRLPKSYKVGIEG